LQEEILEKWKLDPERAEEIRVTRQSPHMDVIRKRVEDAVAAFKDESAVLLKHELNKKFDLPAEIRIVPDQDFEYFLKKAYGDPLPQNTYAITIDNTVYLRHSGAYDEKYIQEVMKHEDYHVVSKLDYNRSTRRTVEGFNEIMKYADIQTETNLAVTAELKKEVSIIEGRYREFAAQQYLLKEIIGEDNLVAGHLVSGEGFLRDKFDGITGEGEYKRIFRDAGMSEGDRIDALKQIYAKDHALEEQRFVFRNVKTIREDGKYGLR
jgi:hypothetical protein